MLGYLREDVHAYCDELRSKGFGVAVVLHGASFTNARRTL
jgi:hypothetical protein